MTPKLYELGTGYGDDETMAILRAGQAGKRRLLILAVVRAYRDAPGTADLKSALTLFEMVERAAPQAAERILTHPMVDAWATECLRGFGAPDIGYLSAMAAAAAVRAGIEFEISLPCPRGQIVLPTLGRAYGLGCGAAVVSGGVHGAEIAAPDGSTVRLGDDPRWTPVRNITAGPLSNRLSVDIEDLDPYRAGYPWPVTRRLPSQRADRLAAMVSEAWEWIVAYCPRYVPVISGLLRAIVPVATPEGKRQVSAVTRTACGAVALSDPQNADTVALLLVHEAQHAKLGALMDLVDLHVPDGPKRHRAPWRLDPRPVGALLQGAYAHLGVTDVWRTRRECPWSGTTAAADFEFGYWRTQTSQAVAILDDSGELTGAGARFVAAMAETLATWEDEPLPPGVVAAVRDVHRASVVRWQLHNAAPDPSDVAGLVAAWRADDKAVVPPALPRRSGPPCSADLDGLAAEIARQVSRGDGNPAVFTLLEPEVDGGSHDLITVAERAFLNSEYAAAAAAYRRRLAEAPADDQAWVGLLLSLCRMVPEAAADTELSTNHIPVPELQAAKFPRVRSTVDEGLAASVRGMLTHPELVKAVYGVLVRGSRPTPDSVAAWLVGHRRADRCQSGGGST